MKLRPVGKVDARKGDLVKVRVDLDRSDLSRAAARREVQAWADGRGYVLQGVEVVRTKQRAEKVAERAPQRSDAELVVAYARRMKKGRVTLAAGLKIAEEVA